MEVYKPRTKSYETNIMDLPRVIMVEILSRLPIKPIFCCKCVCKSWYNLVCHDPLFVKLYHSSSPFPCLLLRSPRLGSLSSILELEAEDFDYYSSPLKKSIRLYRDFHLPLWANDLKLIGSCNGFICLLNGWPHERNHSVYISNPLLSEYFKLELTGWEETVSPHSYGFCFSQASGQYKLLRSIVRDFQGGSKVSRELEVYTLGVDEKWRNVGEAPRPLWYSFRHVNVNCAVHWLNDDENFESHAHIYSFIIGSEKLQTLPSPPGLESDLRCLMLAELGNSLCLSDNSNCKHHVDIWWMKEYGLAHSWTRDRISTEFIPLNIHRNSFIPIIIWKDGEILMHNRDYPTLVSYNPNEKKLRQVIVYDCGNKPNIYNEVTTYIPCFYSLKTIMGDNFQVSNAYPKIEIV